MILIKTPEQITQMREGGKHLARILDVVAKKAEPGVTTKELDDMAQKLIAEAGAKTAFLGYEGFPGTICTAINEEGVHVPPSARKLQEGDMLTLDMGLCWKGWYLDMARTIPVEKIDEEKKKLIEATRKALEIGIAEAKPGNQLGDIGFAVQTFAERLGYGVVRELCGHGIGKRLHEDPKVLNYGEPHTGVVLKEGMVICIEPMITTGDWKLKKEKDGHSLNTKDGSLFCHFEDTLAITKKGPVVLTR
jgi:methionyl aminopeptidase